MALVVVFLITLSFIKTNIPLGFNYADIYQINIFNRSTTSVGGREFTSEDDEFEEILDKLNDITNLPIFTRLASGGNINDKVEQDLGGIFNNYTTEMKQRYVAVEIVFSEPQDFVVYYDGDSRVITSWAIIYVIVPGTQYDEVLVFHSQTNDSSTRESQYVNSDPMVLYGITNDFVEYVEELDEIY